VALAFATSALLRSPPTVSRPPRPTRLANPSLAGASSWTSVTWGWKVPTAPHCACCHSAAFSSTAACAIPGTRDCAMQGRTVLTLAVVLGTGAIAWMGGLIAGKDPLPFDEIVTQVFHVVWAVQLARGPYGHAPRRSSKRTRAILSAASLTRPSPPLRTPCWTSAARLTACPSAHCLVDRFAPRWR
jgi:hypothetical protein